jgi:integrase
MKSPARLTDIAIRNLKPGPARYELPDPGARGLYVIVHPSGKTSYAVRYRHAGIPRKLTLQGGITLSVARKLAANAMDEVAQGRDPAEAKLAAKVKARSAREDSVEAVCRNYLRREGPKLRTASARERTLERLVFPAIGQTPIEAVKRSDLVRLIDKIEDKTGPRQADICLRYLGRVFNWHAARTDEFRSPLVRGMGRYNAKEHERSRILSDEEIKKVWEATATGGAFPSFIRFLLLTGARRGEAAGLTWAEIDGTDWKLPAARNKVKADLTRPLSKAAQAVIAAQPRIDGCPFVFSNDGKHAVSCSMGKRKFDAACGVTGWRLHDLRRTARTLLSRAGINADVAERCLGHAIAGVRAVYDRHPFHAEMTHAFEQLAAQIERVVNPPEGDVVPLRPRARS